MDPGPRPTKAEMAQLVALLDERGLIEVYMNDGGHEAYRLTEEGVRIGYMLAMVKGRGSGSGAGWIIEGEFPPAPDIASAR